jgi:hypothetical protein
MMAASLVGYLVVLMAGRMGYHSVVGTVAKLAVPRVHHLAVPLVVQSDVHLAEQKAEQKVGLTVDHWADLKVVSTVQHWAELLAAETAQDSVVPTAVLMVVQLVRC